MVVATTKKAVKRSEVNIGSELLRMGFPLCGFIDGSQKRSVDGVGSGMWV